MKDLAFKERVLQRLITNPKAFVGPAKLSPKNIKNRVRNNINSANDYFDKLSDFVTPPDSITQTQVHTNRRYEALKKAMTV